MNKLFSIPMMTAAVFQYIGVAATCMDAPPQPPSTLAIDFNQFGGADGFPINELRLTELNRAPSLKKGGAALSYSLSGEFGHNVTLGLGDNSQSGQRPVQIGIPTTRLRPPI